MSIVRNSARCRKCGEEVESKHRHDFVTCRCGAISVDGGHDYLKRSAMNLDDIEDTSKEIPDPDEEADAKAEWAEQRRDNENERERD